MWTGLACEYSIFSVRLTEGRPGTGDGWYAGFSPRMQKYRSEGDGAIHLRKAARADNLSPYALATHGLPAPLDILAADAPSVGPRTPGRLLPLLGQRWKMTDSAPTLRTEFISPLYANFPVQVRVRRSPGPCGTQ